MPSVRHAEREDISSIAALLKKVDQYYGGQSSDVTHEDIGAVRDAVLEPSYAIRMLLAHDGATLIGLATYSYLWPAVETTRSIYLKELYVSTAHRRQGVGKLLLSEIFHIAVSEGCSRVEWTTDHDNDDALAFYRAIRAPVYEGKVFYRIEGTAELAEAATRLHDQANGGRAT